MISHKSATIIKKQYSLCLDNSSRETWTSVQRIVLHYSNQKWIYIYLTYKYIHNDTNIRWVHILPPK